MRGMLHHHPGHELDEDVCALYALLNGRRFVVLSGAGISTESGIPDYRSPESLKKARTPVQYKEFLHHEPARIRYWARSFLGFPKLSRAKPNRAHVALASMEKSDRSDRFVGLITQNVDGLHQEAGSRRVLSLHGSIAWVRCMQCGMMEARAALQERLRALNSAFDARFSKAEHVEAAPDGDAELDSEALSSFRAADCMHCRGVLKPDVVFFGENVPKTLVEQAFAYLAEADALLVLGSSLTVFSGFRFVKRASEQAKPVAIVNAGPTRGDSLCSLKVNARLGEFLPKLFSLMDMR